MQKFVSEKPPYVITIDQKTEKQLITSAASAMSSIHCIFSEALEAANRMAFLPSYRLKQNSDPSLQPIFRTFFTRNFRKICTRVYF
jgi:hypothetical protein